MLGYILFNVHLYNHILLQSGGWTWGTALYTVRGVGSGSRDVDVCLVRPDCGVRYRNLDRNVSSYPSGPH